MINVEKIVENLIHWASTKGIKLVIGIVILIVGWKLVKKLLSIMNVVLEKREVDRTLASFLDAVLNISLKILLCIVVMEYVGIATAGLAALLASAGLAVGLALQGSLSNFGGGVIILLIRPFNVGDFIEGDGKSGVVERIGIFYTHLLTPDNKEIMIPNGTLANTTVTNYTSKDLRRVDLTFAVGYEEDVLKVKNVIENVIKTENFILKEPEPFISISEHGDNAVGFIVKAWCKTEDYWTVYYNLLEKVKIRFDEENISIPYPQIDVHIKEK